MSEFSNLLVIEDASMPPDALIILQPRYKWRRSESELGVIEEVLDLDATAKASVVIRNIGG